MVALPLGYCIDSTEVTQGQYQTWLNTRPSTVDLIPACSWNTDFTPSITGAVGWPPTIETLTDPVVNVNWCDAYAYCVGVGKRLCGKIGGGPIAYSDYTNAALSQWYAACTSNGMFGPASYPYGNAYEPSACNGQDENKGGPVKVGSTPTCQSVIADYAGVYDLSGNVGEWEDACECGVCRIRGGNYHSASGQLGCGFDSGAGIPGRFETVGFRCCSP